MENGDKPRVVLVCGTTGAGKSKVAIELALALGGEIVNADAMQMYDGLNVATAKVTEEEMKGVPHHLLSIFPLTTQIDVRTFRDRALEAISDIHSRGRLPIIVGGTNYYIESLLKEGSLVDDLPLGAAPERKEDAEEFESAAPTAKLYEDLAAADPEFASLIHPNDRRKIVRGLQILRDTQQLPSAIYRAQAAVASDRFRCYVFWVHAAPEALNARLEARVDDMVSAGLLAEVEEVFETLKTELLVPDEATTADQDREAGLGITGISQAIGFKEFLPVLRTGAVLYDPETLEPTPEATECLQRVVSNTIKYAKKQVMWLRNKLFARSLPVFVIDTTDPSAELLEPQIGAARDIVSSFLASPAGLSPLDAYVRWARERQAGDESLQVDELPLPMYDGSSHARDADFDEQYKRIYTCEVCGGKALQGKLQWDIHIRSRSHRRLTKKKTHQGATDTPPSHRQKLCEHA